MIRIDVIPLVEANGVKFGMKRSEVRDILGESKEFKKSPLSTTLADDFGYCHVFYDDNDECEAIEIFDEVEVYIDDKLIFPMKKREALKLLKKFFKDLKKDADGLISYKYSIGIYAPEKEMESILIGRENYYED